MLQIFVGIWNWVKDPKNRGIIKLVAIAILVAIILMQCNERRALKAEIEAQKEEAIRVKNNNEALNDTIRQGKINDSTLLAERKALKLTMNELKKGYSDLLIGFEQFKKQNPKVIERFTVTNNETIREVPVYAKMDSLGNGEFKFADSAKYADGNSRKLTGDIKYKDRFFNKKDSSEVDINKFGIYSKPFNVTGNFDLEQKIKLKVGLFEDPKTKKVTIAATTSYPGITFSQLEGADIMSDDISRKTVRNFRKTWSIGLHLGYGASVDLKTSKIGFGPQVGVGLNYSPKWLQWGK